MTVHARRAASLHSRRRPTPPLRPVVALTAALLAVVGAGDGPWAQQAPAPPTTTAPVKPVEAPRQVFRSAREVITVDVIVRDKSGNVVRGLSANDFEIREDGQPQQILNFSFEEIRDKAPARMETADLLAGVQEKLQQQARTSAPAANPAPAPEATPVTSETMAGRRLITLLFDVSSMQPDDVQRAVDSAQKYVSEKMSPADLVAVVTVSSSLNVLTDFTGDRTKVASALAGLGYAEGTSTPPPDASTVATDEAAASSTDDTSTDTSDLDMFNNDIRLRALKTLADTLAPIEQKKSILYFSAGMQRNGQDNQVELRAAINAAVRANVSFYPVDTRGLQAVVPGGDARQASGRGNDMFSGRGVAQQYDSLAGSQDTLTSLAADTGGKAFTDTNDFGEAFARVQSDMSAYYLLAYSSSNPAHDGRFRRIQVRVKRQDLKIESRSGYYAERDFQHTSRGDRETQLQDQLFSAVSATDLPVLVNAGYFRLSSDKYYVPVSLIVPGYAVPVTNPEAKVSLDVLGLVRDEQGRPLGRFRETLQLPPGTGKTLAGTQVLYQSGVTLPPGRFSVKAVVRENASGEMGTFEAAITIPELKKEPLKVSSVVLSTQVEPAATKGKSDNPLIRDGLQLVPNLTHVVARDQKLFFYYEVYDPAEAASAPQVRTSLAFYRGKVKVFETPVVERTKIDAPDRHAALFQFEVPAESFTPGLYTCQINIIDTIAGHFAFPRVTLFVK
jgi:VWFA-related protein